MRSSRLASQNVGADSPHCDRMLAADEVGDATVLGLVVAGLSGDCDRR